MLISLNGTDNTGKTTQSRLLSERTKNSVKLLGSISKYNHKWKTLPEERRFDKKNSEEFIELIIDSILERNNISEKYKDIDLVVLDRGVTMMKSTIIASLQIKNNISYEKSKELLENFILKKYGELKDLEDARILLRYSDDINKNVSYTLRFSDDLSNPGEDTRRYGEYQSHLNEALGHSILDYEFKAYASGSILETQNTIRKFLNEKFKFTLEPFGNNVEKIYGIGGMSESGKSSFGKLLYKNHGMPNLKIKYFADIVKNKHPELDPNSEDFTIYLCLEIDNFANAHYYFKKYSIESLRYPKNVETMQTFWGEKLDVVYIETDIQKRILRTVSETGENIENVVTIVSNKDSEKKEAGANEISDIADHHIYNDGSFERLETKVNNIVKQSHLGKDSYYDADQETFKNLSIPEPYIKVLEKIFTICKINFGERLRLISLGGSAGRQDIGVMSDLDLFLVVDGLQDDEVKEFKENKRYFDGIKVGYTFLDSDCIRGKTDPKYIYNFRGITGGEFPILYLKNFSIPKFSIHDEIETRKGTIFNYFLVTKHDLLEAEQNKDIFSEMKHIYTIMKMLLIIVGKHAEGYSTVYQKFYEVFGVDNIPVLPEIQCMQNMLFDGEIIKQKMIQFLEYLECVIKSIEKI